MKSAVTGLSGLLALVLLLPMEAGVPIPLPADLVMFAVGERVAAGKFPLWLAVVGLEVIAVLGTTALFLACRGPAQRIIARFGPRLGLTEARLRRAAAFAETRGRPGLALGRGTPGLRTLTVIAAAVSGLSARRALPALIAGSSVFLQLHLVLGLLFGPLADRAFDQVKGAAVVAGAALVAGGFVYWLIRRRRRTAAPAAWTEAVCPACVGVSLLAERVPGLAGLARLDPVSLPGDTHTVPPGDTHTVPPGDPDTVPPGDPNTVQPGDTHTVPPGDPDTVPPGGPDTVPSR
jgi:membrane protein DedA with SNARE-associated domain